MIDRDIRVIYVAGPCRATTAWQRELNVREAEEAAAEIWHMGDVAVICPHANTRWHQDEVLDDVVLNGYLEVLSRCDAVFFVDGWEESEGANLEYELAIKADIPVFSDLGELRAWIND